jgi:hypothetical protein
MSVTWHFDWLYKGGKWHSFCKMFCFFNSRALQSVMYLGLCFKVSYSYRQSVGLLGRGISPPQGATARPLWSAQKSYLSKLMLSPWRYEWQPLRKLSRPLIAQLRCQKFFCCFLNHWLKSSSCRLFMSNLGRYDSNFVEIMSTFLSSPSERATRDILWRALTAELTQCPLRWEDCYE